MACSLYKDDSNDFSQTNTCKNGHIPFYAPQESTMFASSIHIDYLHTEKLTCECNQIKSFSMYHILYKLGNFIQVKVTRGHETTSSMSSVHIKKNLSSVYIVHEKRIIFVFILVEILWLLRIENLLKAYLRIRNIKIELLLIFINIMKNINYHCIICRHILLFAYQFSTKHQITHFWMEFKICLSSCVFE